MSVFMMASFQRLVSSAGSNTVQYVLVGENGQITPLGHPVHTQVRTVKVERGREMIENILFRGKLETWIWALTARPLQNPSQKM